jgi:hypothetical protein
VVRDDQIIDLQQTNTMELQSIARLSVVNGATLSVEEVSGLETAMIQRSLAENLAGKMMFWGKVFGTTQDYLVVYNINPYSEFPDKKYYYWSAI